MASRPTRKAVSTRASGFRRCPSEKAGYAGRAEALDVAELMMLEGKVNPGCHITPYQCPDCGEWHVANRVIVAVGRRARRREEE